MTVKTGPATGTNLHRSVKTKKVTKSELRIVAIPRNGEREEDALERVMSEHPTTRVSLAGGKIGKKGLMKSQDGKRAYSINSADIKSDPIEQIGVNPKQVGGDASQLQKKIGAMASDELKTWRNEFDISIATALDATDRLANAGGEIPKWLNPHQAWKAPSMDECIKELDSQMLRGPRLQAMRISADEGSLGTISLEDVAQGPSVTVRITIVSEAISRDESQAHTGSKKRATYVEAVVGVTTKTLTTGVISRGTTAMQCTAGRPVKISCMGGDFSLIAGFLGNNGLEMVMNRSSIMPLMRRLRQPVNLELAFLKGWLYFHAALWSTKFTGQAVAYRSYPSAVLGSGKTNRERMNLAVRFDFPLEAMEDTPKSVRMARMLVDRYPMEEALYQGFPVRPSAVTLPGGPSHGAVLSELPDEAICTLGDPRDWLTLLYGLAGRYGLEHQMLRSLHTARELIEREESEVQAVELVLDLPMDFAPMGSLGEQFFERGPSYPAPECTDMLTSEYVTSQLISIRQRTSVAIDLSMALGYDNSDSWPSAASRAVHNRQLYDRLGAEDITQWKNSAIYLVGNCCFSGNEPGAASGGLAKQMIQLLPRNGIDKNHYSPALYMAVSCAPKNSAGGVILGSCRIDRDSLDAKKVQYIKNESNSDQAARLDLLNWLKAAGWFATPEWWSRMSMPGSKSIVIPGIQMYSTGPYHGPTDVFELPIPFTDIQPKSLNLPALVEATAVLGDRSPSTTLRGPPTLIPPEEVAQLLATNQSLPSDHKESSSRSSFTATLSGTLSEEESKEGKHAEQHAFEPLKGGTVRITLPPITPAGATMRDVCNGAAERLMKNLKQPVEFDISTLPTQTTFRPGLPTNSSVDQGDPSGSLSFVGDNSF